MKFRQITDPAIASTRSPFSHHRVHDALSEEVQVLPDGGANGSEDNKMTPAGDNHSYQLAGEARINVLEIYRVFMKRYLSVYVFCIWTVAAMGSGSGGGGGGGGGGSAENNPLRQEVGTSAFKVYNQGVDLMHAKKFAAAQIKFEQAIRDNPNFAEAHNNLGFTLRQQGPQNYSKALEHYSKAIQLKPNMAETYEYRGVLFAKMGRRVDAEKDLATLKKLNPKLAGELEQFLKTGKEEDEYGATSPKQKS
jgi:tetratricopeptide (TPR) repeat protein